MLLNVSTMDEIEKYCFLTEIYYFTLNLPTL